MLTPANRAEIALMDCDPLASNLAARAARLAQPSQALTPADQARMAQADCNPRVHRLTERAGRLAQPARVLTPADQVEITRADHNPQAAELVKRAARLARTLLLTRRRTRASDVLAQPFELPPAPAGLAPALAKVRRADQAASLARANEHKSEIALEQLERRRPSWVGWLTGARRRFNREIIEKQRAAEICANERQRADAASAVAHTSARKLARQHERAIASARDTYERRREQARSQLRWCADAQIALRDFPDIAVKNIRDAVDEIRRRRERLEEAYYNTGMHRRIIVR